MSNSKLWLILTALVLALSLALVVTACGDDDDDDDDDDDSGDDDDDDDSGGDTLTGYVRDFQTDQELSDVTVEILDHETGLPFDPAITETSDSTGFVEFEVPAGVAKVAVRTSALGSIDTLQYDFARDAQEEEFLLVSDATLSIIATLLGVEVDPALTNVAGSVYWGDPTDETPVGCAEVTITPDGEDDQTVYYFSDDRLPTTDRGAPGTNPVNGNFVAVNSPVAPTTMMSDADGNTSTIELPMTYTDTIIIQNFYYSKDDFTSLDELEPDDCE